MGHRWHHCEYNTFEGYCFCNWNKHSVCCCNRWCKLSHANSFFRFQTATPGLELNYGKPMELQEAQYLFKSFSPVITGDIPEVFLPYNADITNTSFNQTLFQGNQFFFTARTPTQGIELWISDGTSGGTQVVKDINPGSGSGVDTTGGSYLYTTSTLFFSGNDGTFGNELWKTDGTSANTSMVKDINLNAKDADPNSLLIFNGKIMFNATDGDDPNAFDLFVVDGIFTPLPIRLTDFTVSLIGSDGLLKWNTAQELNTKNYTVQRSFDGQHFTDIGVVQAAAFLLTAMRIRLLTLV